MAITVAKQYISALDEVYKLAVRTSVLDSDSSLVREGANAGEICVPKITMDGLADYSRTSGYVNGTVNLTWETIAADYERGRKFSVDVLDDEETRNVAFGRLAGEFLRVKVGPELDAVRIAKYAGTSNIGSATGTLSTGADAIAALRACANAMNDAEVNPEGRFLFITPAAWGLVEDLATTASREVMANFGQVIQMPQNRMYTAVDLYDGTTSGEEAGGYVKASGAKDINFLCVTRNAVSQFAKHVAPKIIAPENNADADAYIYTYRITAVARVFDNKLAGVYCHHKA